MSKGAVFITGASSGIGREAAVRMATLGYRVFAGVRKEADGQAIARVVPLTPVIIDVTDRDSISRAAEQVSGALKGDRLIGIINNAGITIVGPLEYLELNSLRQQLEVNLIGYLAVAQAFLPLLRASKGRIINMGSMVGRTAIPFGGPYAISKYGVEALTESLRMELKPWQIPVSLISPGAIATPLWDKSLRVMDAAGEALPEHAQRMYGPALKKIRQYQVDWATGGIAPEKVVKAVLKALTARRPARRYVVGSDAWQAELLRLLPAPLKEALLLWKMGLNSRPEPTKGGTSQPASVGESAHP